MSASFQLAIAAANSNAANTYVRYASMLVGRDKMCRLGQYFSRLMVYLITERMRLRGKTPNSIEWLTTFSKMQGVLGTTRKLLRAGKFFDFLQLFLRALVRKGDDELVHALGALHKVGMFVFMAADTVGVLGSSLALVKLRDPGKITRIAQRGWLLALVCQAMSAIYRLRGIAMREVDLRRVRLQIEKSADVMGDRECAVEEQLVRKNKAQATRELVAAALDLTIPIKGLGLLAINEGVVALAGTVTSLMGIQDALAKAWAM
ncbi:Peroxisomal membrane protein PMP27 [Coemansia sp. RSA 1722]|nr:Peroxisomal membrane protein PMP27 [Coemansia sp. RSA 486]KAJ2235532.1 Peroxisomal membrane protein PMP27 [Coemansia sp. RSA 485]KAJ2588342.1 Peroxisomal membrane protein PMP27 [Coemansia sp. RSA 1722]